MVKHQLDLEQSKAVYEKCKRHIKIKHCYNNVFECVTDYISNFHSGKWKVAYGYVEVMAGLYCRHCFILNENGKVIDPTFYVQSEQRDREYYVMIAFDDIDEYFLAIESDNCMPALEKYLHENDKKALQWANENGVIFVG